MEVRAFRTRPGVTKRLGDQLPIHYQEEGGGRRGLIPLFVFGLLWIGADIALVVRIFHQYGPSFELIPAIFFGLLGVTIVAIVGILTMSQGSDLKIDIEGRIVRCWEKKPFRKPVTWTSDLSEYQGIMPETWESAGRRACNGYRVALWHSRDRAKDIELFNSGKTPGVAFDEAAAMRELRTEAEKFARLFSLPMLHQSPKGVETRGVADLDRPLQERIRSGNVQVQFSGFDYPPGRGISVRRVGVDTEFRFSLLKMFWAAVIVLPFGLFPLMLAIAIESIVFGVVGLVFTGVGAYCLFMAFFGSERVRVSPSEIVGFKTIFGVPFGRKGMGTAEIEEAVISSRKKTDRPTIRLLSDRVTIDFGQTLSMEQKEWVRNGILHTIGNR